MLENFTTCPFASLAAPYLWYASSYRSPFLAISVHASVNVFAWLGPQCCVYLSAACSLSGYTYYCREYMTSFTTGQNYQTLHLSITGRSATHIEPMQSLVNGFMYISLTAVATYLFYFILEPHTSQWRSQKLCVRGADPTAGGARVEAPKAPSEWSPGNTFSAYSRPQNASRRKKKSFSVKFSSMNYCRWSNNNFLLLDKGIFCIF